MRITYDENSDKDIRPLEEWCAMKRSGVSKSMPSFEDVWKIELRRGILQYAILAIVRRYENGIHGYRIAKELDERTGGLLEVKDGTLYPILHRLSRERLLNVHTERSDSGPSKKIYVLTGEGDRVYRELSVILIEIFRHLEALRGE